MCLQLRAQNPEFEYRLVDNAEAEKFMKTHFKGPIADSYFSIDASIGAARADLWRYCALYHHGGVYLDVDSGCSVPFREILRDNDTAVVTVEGTRNFFTSGGNGVTYVQWGELRLALPQR